MQHCPCVACQAGCLYDARLGTEMLAGVSRSSLYRSDCSVLVGMCKHVHQTAFGCCSSMHTEYIITIFLAMSSVLRSLLLQWALMVISGIIAFHVQQ